MPLVTVLLLATLLATSSEHGLRAQAEPPAEHQAKQPPAEQATQHRAVEVTYGKHAANDRARVAAELFQKTWDPNDPRPTCKVFHQIFAPDGTLLTKGLGGMFEHHRGLFVGWNKTKFRGKHYDFWHLHKGESQRFRKLVSPTELSMGPHAQVHQIDWVAPDEQLVIRELRGLEVVDYSDTEYVLHMRVQCSTQAHDVELGGDPQHAGQQFRALQQFAEKDAKPVTYLRPDGAKDHGNDVWTDCDWIACVMELPKATYTVLRIEGDHNPGTTTWSTRPYGRFGSTRTVTVTEQQPMRMDQYYVVANGARDAAWCQAQAAKWRKPQKKSQ